MCSSAANLATTPYLCIISYHANDVWLLFPTNFYATLIYVAFVLQLTLLYYYQHCNSIDAAIETFVTEKHPKYRIIYE